MSTDNEDYNPCSFKAVCKHCALTTSTDRPTLCKSLGCTDYTPCPECGRNLALNPGNGKCRFCAGERANKKVSSVNPSAAIIGGRVVITDAHGEEVIEEQAKPTDFRLQDSQLSGADRRTYSITMPGTPPPELSADEHDYYVQRWSDYKGYYRDPAAYVICHHMILEELNLGWIQSQLLATRGEANSTLESQKLKSLSSLQKMKHQLPEKEASELSDEEKALNMIYESYCREKELCARGKVSRVFTQEAIALAPELVHKIDPAVLLQRCGFNVVAANEAAEKVIPRGEIDAIGVLEFFGYKLKEKYAMPYNIDNAEVTHVQDGNEEL